MSRYWYAHTFGDDTNPNNWTKTNANPYDLCNNGSVSCVIRARPNGLNPTRPVITPNLEQYIIYAKATQIPFPGPPSTPYAWPKSS